MLKLTFFIKYQLYISLGKLYFYQDRDDKALESYYKSIKISKNVFGNEYNFYITEVSDFNYFFLKIINSKAKLLMF